MQPWRIFSPEDLSPFDLQRSVDPDTGFIAIKSHDGRDRKILQWPGLWNGCMTYWKTVFVAVPLTIFNPVKTVLDL
jgi:hypothetical protein